MIYSHGGITLSPRRVSPDTVVGIWTAKLRAADKKISKLETERMLSRDKHAKAAMESALRELRITRNTLAAELQKKQSTRPLFASALLKGKEIYPRFYPMDNEDASIPAAGSPKSFKRGPKKPAAAKAVAGAKDDKADARKKDKQSDMERRVADAKRDVSKLQDEMSDAQAHVDNARTRATKKETTEARDAVEERLQAAQIYLCKAEEASDAFISRGGKRGQTTGVRG